MEIYDSVALFVWPLWAHDGFLFFLSQVTNALEAGTGCILLCRIPQVTLSCQLSEYLASKAL